MNAVFECIAKWETAYTLSYGSPIEKMRGNNNDNMVRLHGES